MTSSKRPRKQGPGNDQMRAPESDKAARIRDAAITEFAERGFVSASTNAIAERAGVAKGLVFHYFDDKDALFLACVKDMEKIIQAHFVHMLDGAPNDLIGRILAVIEKKLEFIRAEPRASRFLLVGMGDAPPALRKKARALLEPTAQRLWGEVLKGIDASTLRPGLKLEDAVELIMIVSQGIERRNEALTDSFAKAKSFDVAAAVAHSRRILEVLRDGFYK